MKGRRREGMNGRAFPLESAARYVSVLPGAESAACDGGGGGGGVDNSSNNDKKIKLMMILIMI